MGSHHHKKPWHQAHRQIATLIRTRKESGITHLPTLRQLASGCGVTPVTMRSVLEAFRKKRILHIRSGVGIFINTPHTASPDVNSVPDPDTVATDIDPGDAIRKALTSDIEAGHFRPDRPLPTYKELCRRYGTSYLAMRKALLSLLPTGMIRRQGRGYRITQAPPRSTPNTIILIARRGDRPALCTYTHRSIEFWRELERECKRTNITVEIMAYTDAINALKKNRLKDILGFMIWVLGLNEPEMRELGILLAQHNTPVSILDEIGSVPIPIPVRNNPYVKYFTVANTPRSAEILARHILADGHRRIALFLPIRGYSWFDNRETGLKTIFSHAGFDSAVTPFSLSTPESFEKVYEHIRSSQSYLDLVSHRQRHSNATGPQYPLLISKFYDHQAMSMLSGNYWYTAMEPLFAKALEDRSITAWVGISDDIALFAKDFLVKRRVAVPEWISVYGFDDSIEALEAGLTSYNFNITAVVQSMIDHLLRPGLRPDRRQEMPVEIEGNVIVRETSGPAAGKNNKIR